MMCFRDRIIWLAIDWMEGNEEGELKVTPRLCLNHFVKGKI